MLLYLLLSGLTVLTLAEFLGIISQRKAGIKKAKKLINSKEFEGLALNMPKDIGKLFDLIEKNGFKMPKYCDSADNEQKKMCYSLVNDTEGKSMISKSEIDIGFNAYTKSKSANLFMKRTFYNIDFLYTDNECTRTCILFKHEIKSSVNEVFQSRTTKKH